MAETGFIHVLDCLYYFFSDPEGLKSSVAPSLSDNRPNPNATMSTVSFDLCSNDTIKVVMLKTDNRVQVRDLSALMRRTHYVAHMYTC